MVLLKYSYSTVVPTALPIPLAQELEEAQEEVEEKMTRKLNMPPVMEARKDTSQVATQHCTST